MAMAYSHTTNCSSFLRNNFTAWNAWPRNRFFLRTSYVSSLTWLDLRSYEFMIFVDYLVPNISCWDSHALFLFQNESYLTLKDFRRCKLSGHFFNILFNLNKFMAFEARDPFLIRQVSQIPTHTYNIHWQSDIFVFSSLVTPHTFFSCKCRCVKSHH